MAIDLLQSLHSMMFYGVHKVALVGDLNLVGEGTGGGKYACCDEESLKRKRMQSLAGRRRVAVPGGRRVCAGPVGTGAAHRKRQEKKS